MAIQPIAVVCTVSHTLLPFVMIASKILFHKIAINTNSDDKQI